MTRITCEEFCQFLDTYLDGELEPRDRGDFDAHVAACPDCRTRLDHQLWFRGAMRPHLKRPERMPAECRQRLQSRLRAADRPARAIRIARRLAVPVPAVAAVGAVFLMVTPLTGFTPLVEDAVDQHRQNLPAEIPSPRAEEAEAWFHGKLPFELKVPRFSPDRVALLGGRLTRVGGGESGLSSRRAAYLVYGVGPHKMTVLVFDANGVSLDTVGKQKTVAGRTVVVRDTADLNFALYREGNLAYAVTSDLPTERMVELVAAAH
jgi:anti-sigma factor RsiW